MRKPQRAHPCVLYPLPHPEASLGSVPVSKTVANRAEEAGRGVTHPSLNMLIYAGTDYAFKTKAQAEFGPFYRKLQTMALLSEPEVARFLCESLAVQLSPPPRDQFNRYWGLLAQLGSHGGEGCMKLSHPTLY